MQALQGHHKGQPLMIVVDVLTVQDKQMFDKHMVAKIRKLKYGTSSMCGYHISFRMHAQRPRVFQTSCGQSGTQIIIIIHSLCSECTHIFFFTASCQDSAHKQRWYWMLAGRPAGNFCWDCGTKECERCAMRRTRFQIQRTLVPNPSARAAERAAKVNWAL